MAVLKLMSKRQISLWFSGPVVCLLVTAMLSLQPVSMVVASTQIICEDQLPHLYAALVMKIAVFVTWPEDAPEFPGGEFPLGLFGDEHQLAAFQKMSDEKIEGREVLLLKCEGEGAAHRARIIFYSGMIPEAEFLAELSPGVLTIGDTPGFNARGGMIELGIRNGRPGFTVNLEAVNASGIVLSSRLLKIAKIFEGGTS